MFIETVPNRESPPAVLLRESYRDENGRAQKRTLANLSKLPPDVIDGLKALLKGHGDRFGRTGGRPLAPTWACGGDACYDPQDRVGPADLEHVEGSGVA